MYRKSTVIGLALLICLSMGMLAATQAPTAGQAKPQPAATGQAKPQPPAAAPAQQARPAGMAVAMGDPPAPKKHVLILGFTEGFHHASTSDGLAMIHELGVESGLFDTEIRTDTKWLTKTGGGFGASMNLNYFDAIVAVNTTGTWQMTDQQKKDFISAIHDDGKGFVAVHAALDCNHNGVWPEFTEMLGGEFVAHPWFTFAAPVIIEDSTFPAMRHLPSAHMVFYDEMYVPKDATWSRSKVNVLMRLDESKLPPPGPQEPYATQSGMAALMKSPDNPLAKMGAAGIREDKDYALAWSKMYGSGRVFYSSLGHTKEAYLNPDVRRMYLEAIKWVLGFSEGKTASHPKVNPKETP
jgi:type 1 glutamine amidotransferase